MKALAVSAIVLLVGACAPMTEKSSVNGGLVNEEPVAFTQGQYESASQRFAAPGEQNDLLIQIANDGGVAQDNAGAVDWLLKSAEQRNPYALSVLGSIFKEGRGVQKDNVKAHMWFDLAVAEFYYKPGRNYAEQERDAVAKKMTIDEIAEAREMARQWLREHGGLAAAESDI